MHSLGIAEVRFEDESRKFENSSRPLDATIWYPTEKSALAQKVAKIHQDIGALAVDFFNEYL